MRSTRNRLELNAESDAEDEVELARTGIGGQAGIDGQVVLLLDEEVLRGSERNVGAGKVVGAVARRTPRHNANSPHPVEFCQAERCRQLEVTAVGSLVAAVQTIVASKIRVPCGREEAEVVAYEALPDMGCLVCMILEVTALGKPVVGHTYAESFVFVLESQVQLLGVGTVADAYAARAAYETLSIEDHMQQYLDQGLTQKEAMRRVAADRGLSRRDIYQQIKVR